MKPIKITVSASSGPTEGHQPAYVAYLDAVTKASKGKITFDIVWYGALLEATQEAAGIGKGIADMGGIRIPYTPALFPAGSLLVDLTFTTGNPLVAVAAQFEMYIVTDPVTQKEMKNANLKPLFGYATTSYDLLTKKPIRTLDQVKGLKARSGGAPWSRLATAIGAVPVTMPFAEVVEGMQRGTIDAILFPYLNMKGFNLYQVTPYVTLLGGGLWSGNVDLMNLDVWNRLPDVAKRIFIDLLPYAQRLVLENDQKASKAVMTEAKAAKVTFLEPAADLRDAVQKFLEADAKSSVERIPKGMTETDAKAVINEYLRLVTKWRSIVDGINPDRAENWSEADFDKYQEALWREIYSKMPLK